MPWTSELADTVIVFDLDDTLYPEEAYVRSGIVAVCALAAGLFGVDHTPELLALRDAGERDWLTALCERLPSGAGARDSLLWVYRLHEPRIALDPEVRALVNRVMAEARGTAIITDGRSVTQRLKLRALGLSTLQTYVSEEYGNHEKPDPTRFLAVMSDFPADQYLYVADNPAKDFIAPRALGWLTIGVVGQGDRVHALPEKLQAIHSPDEWLADVSQLLDIRSSSRSPNVLECSQQDSRGEEELIFGPPPQFPCMKC